MTWTLAKSSSYSSLPPAVELAWSYNGTRDQVFFSETTKAQLGTNGLTVGTFEDAALAESHETSNSVDISQAGLSPGNLVRSAFLVTLFSPSCVSDVRGRQSKWGLRIKCAKLPDAENTMSVRKNYFRLVGFLRLETVCQSAR